MKNYLLVLLMVTGFCLLANTPPEVSNVTFSQRTDGSQLVDIYYDVMDADGDQLTITMEVSADGGENFDLSCEQVSGDIGENIVAGVAKQIVWDLGTEHPELESDEIMIAITAEDNQSGGEPGWAFVSAGSYTSGENDIIQNIDYDYEIMIYEVTNAQYVEYLNEAYAAGDIWITDNGSRISGNYSGDPMYPAGEYEYYNLAAIIVYHHGRIAFSGDSFHVEVPVGYSSDAFDDHPVVEVTWMGANAYAEHYGYRLPTAEEWEKAARGMTGWTYPFGDNITPPGNRANFNNSMDPWDQGTTPVGFYNGQTYQNFVTIDSPSPYGCYDMCGNATEWTNSFSPIFPSRRIMMGGSWYWSGYQDYFRSWYQYGVGSENVRYDYGFRCARDVENGR